MKYKNFFYTLIFPILFIFPTINILAYYGITIPQLTFSNIAIVVYIILSFTYKIKVKTTITIGILFFLLIIFNSEFIGSITLSSDALNRSFISILYYFYIILIFIAIYRTVAYLYKNDKNAIALNIIKRIGYLALFNFYIITLYQYIFKVSPILLSSDPTLGYRDFRNPLIDNIHNYDVFRALGSFSEPSMYAGFIVVLLPLMLKNNNLYINILIFSLTIISVLLTYSRIGILLIIILYLLFILLSNKKILFIILNLMLLMIMLSIDYIYFNGLYLFNNILRVINLFQNITDVSIQTRIMAPLKLFQYTDEQLIFGYGLGSLIDIFPKLNLSEEYLQFKVPTLNNLYLNFIVEFGLLSFIIILIYFFIFIYKIFYYKIHKKYKYEFVSFLIALAYFFQIGHLTMFYMYFILIYFFILNYLNLQKEKQNANPK